jgi:predicted O-methyltransferase YrrM
MNKARDAAAHIQGWLTSAEGERLFTLAASCRPGATIVEIGSWKGKSTTWLALGATCRAGTQVIAIDPHLPSIEQTYVGGDSGDPHAELLANLTQAGVADRVDVRRRRAEDVATTFDRSIDLLFVDGDHDELAVRRDIDTWAPKVPEGGVVAFHDAFNVDSPGVARALRPLLWRTNEWRVCGVVDSLIWVRRVARNGMGDRIRNRVFAAFLLIHAAWPASLRGVRARLRLSSRAS